MPFDGTKTLGTSAPDLDDWYVPDLTLVMTDGEVWHNRKDDDPFRVKISVLSSRALSVLEGNTIGKFTQGLSNTNMDERLEEAVDSQIAITVTEVYGWRSPSYATPGKVYEPTNGQDLMTALWDGPPQLLKELRDDLLKVIKDHAKLAQGLRKNLKRPSASPSDLITPPESGVATGAAVKKPKA